MQLRLPQSFYLPMLIVLIVSAVGAYFAFLQDSEQRETLTAEAPAKITKTEVRYDIVPETGMKKVKDSIVNYTYEIDGQKYEKVTRIGRVAASSFDSWEDAKICYSPMNTETAELFPLRHVCGTTTAR